MKRLLFITFLLMGWSAGTAFGGTVSGHSHDPANPFIQKQTRHAHCQLNGHVHVHANQPCPHRSPYRSAHTEIGYDCGGQPQGTVPAASSFSLKTVTTAGVRADIPLLPRWTPVFENTRRLVSRDSTPPSPPPKSF